MQRKVQKQNFSGALVMHLQYRVPIRNIPLAVATARRDNSLAVLLRFVYINVNLMEVTETL